MLFVRDFAINVRKVILTARTQDDIYSNGRLGRNLVRQGVDRHKTSIILVDSLVMSVRICVVETYPQSATYVILEASNVIAPPYIAAFFVANSYGERGLKQ